MQVNGKVLSIDDRIKFFKQTEVEGVMYAKSGMVPEMYRGNPAACTVIVQLAEQYGMAPLFLFQKIFRTHNNSPITTDAQLTMALAYKSGVFDGVISHEFLGEPGTMQFKCIATVKMAGTGQIVTKELTWGNVVAEGWHQKNTRNGGIFKTKWSTIPRHMFELRTSLWLIRTYCPQSSLGFYSEEEVEEMQLLDGGDEKPVSNEANEKTKPFSNALDAAPEMPEVKKEEVKPNKCIACSGSGENSKGKECKPCDGTGIKKTEKENNEKLKKEADEKAQKVADEKKKIDIEAKKIADEKKAKEIVEKSKKEAEIKAAKEVEEAKTKETIEVIKDIDPFAEEEKKAQEELKDAKVEIPEPIEKVKIDEDPFVEDYVPVDYSEAFNNIIRNSSVYKELGIQKIDEEIERIVGELKVVDWNVGMKNKIMQLLKIERKKK